MNKYYYTRFGQAYGEGSYSECVYNNTQDCETTGGGTGTGTGGGTGTDSGSNGGQLTDTGFTILIIATAACLILFAALIVRIWRRPARQEATQEATHSDQDTLGRL